MTRTMSNTTPAGVNLQQFQSKPFDVEGDQVTEENFEAMAAWCGGSIVTVQGTEDTLDGDGAKRYIQVEVSRPLSPRQSQAYVGDWILYSHKSKSYKVYGNRPFQKNFEAKVSANKEAPKKLEEPVDPPQELFVTNEPAYSVDHSTIPPTIRPENRMTTDSEPIVHEAGVSGPDTVAGGNWGGHE